MAILLMIILSTSTAVANDRLREILEAQEAKYSTATNLIATLTQENNALNLVLDRQIEIINDYDDKIDLLKHIHRRERLQARSRGVVWGAGIMAGMIAVLKYIKVD